MTAPLVISASRRTDIPAFYADWFMSRMEAGFCEYPNPFSQKPVHVDLTKAKCIVFWTKNPVPMFKHLKRLDDMGIKYYFQYTLNNYDDTGLEPELKCVEERIRDFQLLSERIEKEKVIFRYDPLILANGMRCADLMRRVLEVANKVCNYTEKMIFSFADLDYQKVKLNLERKAIEVREFHDYEMETIGELLGKFGREAGIKVATCSERIDLSKNGIEHNRCVDPELILRLTDNDEEVARYLMGNSGQRNLCGCAKSVDIGIYDTCVHNCAYCYATRSVELARANYGKHLSNQHNKSII